jgi:NAD(P) transhydrogenase subunit alpha
VSRIGITRETTAGETRVAATPTTVRQLIALGYDVVVEAGSGERSDFFDAAYREAGATVVPSDAAWDAEVILRVNAPTLEEVERLHDGTILVSLLAPALNTELIDALAAKPITALAMDAVPRISRAQSLDVLSSMANIAGYRAVKPWLDGGRARVRADGATCMRGLIQHRTPAARRLRYWNLANKGIELDAVLNHDDDIS